MKQRLKTPPPQPHNFFATSMRRSGAEGRRKYRRQIANAFFGRHQQVLHYQRPVEKPMLGQKRIRLSRALHRKRARLDQNHGKRDHLQTDKKESAEPPVETIGNLIGGANLVTNVRQPPLRVTNIGHSLPNFGNNHEAVELEHLDSEQRQGVPVHQRTRILVVLQSRRLVGDVCVCVCVCVCV
jgi:hypothetical protein